MTAYVHSARSLTIHELYSCSSAMPSTSLLKIKNVQYDDYWSCPKLSVLRRILLASLNCTTPMPHVNYLYMSLHLSMCDCVSSQHARSVRIRASYTHKSRVHRRCIGCNPHLSSYAHFCAIFLPRNLMSHTSTIILHCFRKLRPRNPQYDVCVCCFR